MYSSIAYGLGQPPQQYEGQQQPNPLISFMPILLIFFVFYILLIRPQSKARQQHEKMISELKKNDEIITTGGIHGTIINVKDKTFVLRVDDNVKIEISKSAVALLKKRAEG